MPRGRTAYGNTSVPVARSQECIRRLLIESDVRGVQFTEDWMAGVIGFQFVKEKDFDGHKVPLLIRMHIQVWTDTKQRLHASRQEKEKRERQVWRALYWYMKSQLEAVAFGLRTLEDVFFSDLVMHDGRTIGDHVRGALVTGKLALPASIENV